MVRVLSTMPNDQFPYSNPILLTLLYLLRQRSTAIRASLVCAFALIAMRRSSPFQLRDAAAAAAVQMGPLTPLPMAEQWYNRVESVIQANRRRNDIAGNDKASPIIFHLLHTTGDSTFQDVNKRVMDSILYHHPPANVTTTIIFHTPQYAPEESRWTFHHPPPMTTAPVQQFLDAGYDVHVIPFHLQSVVEAFVHQQFAPNKVPAHIQGILDPVVDHVHDFIGKIPRYSRTKYWYANQADLIRIVVLYLFGGIYIDTDVILLRPMMHVPSAKEPEPFKAIAKHDVPPPNSIGRQGPGGSVNGAIMKFEHRHNAFIGLSLQSYFAEFSATKWGHQCPQLFTRVFRRLYDAQQNNRGVHYVEDLSVTSNTANQTKQQHEGQNNELQTPIVTVLPHPAYYPFEWSGVETQCMTNVPTETKPTIKKLIDHPSYTVHLSNKVTKGKPPIPGSVCEWLYNSFCVLGVCDSTIKDKYL